MMSLFFACLSHTSKGLAHYMKRNVNIQPQNGYWKSIETPAELRYVQRVVKCNIEDQADVFYVHNIPVVVGCYKDITSRGTPIYNSIIMNKSAIILTDCAKTMRKQLEQRYRGIIDTSANPSFAEIP